MRRTFVFAAMLSVLTFVGAGCITFNAGTSGAYDGGVFKTADKGDTWAQKNAVPTTSGEKRNINGVSITTLTQDPQDPNALYIGTTDAGLFYTYDAGESWMQPLQLTRGRVPSISVDAKNKCVVYAATENKIVKTTDCSRSWSVRFIDTRTEKLTTAVMVDSYNPTIVWAANNAGDVLKSTDGGTSWANIHHFDSAVLQLKLNPSDTRKVFIATKSNGIWRSDDAGANWKDLSPGYKQFDGSNDFSDMAIGVSDAKMVMFASKYGLLRSADNGDTWHPIALLTTPGTTLIYSVAIDPKNTANLYYGTATTFYRSANGGVNWVPKKLPTSRAATVLRVDNSNSTVLYMGVTRFN